MTNKSQLLPCPFCGETLTVNNENLGVHPRFSECLFAQQVVVVDDATQLDKWNTRAAPAEDVRAVVDEPVGHFTFCQDKNKWIQGKPKGREFAHLFTPLYRHPQCPVVMPERMDPDSAMSEAYDPDSWNACLDEFARLNK